MYEILLLILFMTVLLYTLVIVSDGKIISKIFNSTNGRKLRIDSTVSV